MLMYFEIQCDKAPPNPGNRLSANAIGPIKFKRFRKNMRAGKSLFEIYQKRNDYFLV